MPGGGSPRQRPGTRGHARRRFSARVYKTERICREVGVSAQAFYVWKQRYAGVGVSELRELRQLRDENRKLKTLGWQTSLGHMAAARVEEIAGGFAQMIK